MDLAKRQGIHLLPRRLQLSQIARWSNEQACKQEEPWQLLQRGASPTSRPPHNCSFSKHFSAGFTTKDAWPLERHRLQRRTVLTTATRSASWLSPHQDRPIENPRHICADPRRVRMVSIPRSTGARYLAAAA